MMEPHITGTTEEVKKQTPRVKKYFNTSKQFESCIYYSTYSDDTAIVMAECSELAYEEEHLLKNHLEDGQMELKLIRDEDPQFFLAEHAHYIVLAFRGTESDNIQDIITDLSIKRQSTKQGKIHTGFLNSYCRVHHELSSYLKNTNKPIYITGHSMGAALAVIATAQLSSCTLSACYNFGSPHIGSPEFDSHLRVPVYRIVNVGDIVPNLLNWHVGYYHPGYTYYLTKGNQLTRSLGVARRVSNFVIHQKYKWLKKDQKSLLSHHSMSEYLRKLQKIAVSRRNFTYNSVCD
ncbi:MAG: lipase family protein [Bdellovibrionales bacterium]|nr:lipase family protein [Bdellovibrionales bacterium]